MVRKVTTLPSKLLKGPQGTSGKDGTQGPKGLDGSEGRVGLKGDQGDPGRAPIHEVMNGEIRFMQPDGEWGDWMSITSASGGGSISFNSYTSITTNTFTVSRQKLTLGINVFGVQSSGPTTITLPKKIDSRSIVIIKDETGNAAANPITIQIGE